jgi:hypothetical protein
MDAEHDRARQRREKADESPKGTNPRGIPTVLSAHHQEAHAGAEQAAKTAVASGNYGSKTLESTQGRNHHSLSTAKSVRWKILIYIYIYIYMRKGLGAKLVEYC